jgi:hypothetical protein
MHWYARPEGDNRQLRVAPRLFSGEKTNHPERVQLRAFLDDTEALLAASKIDGPWVLRLDVGLSPELDLFDKRDLDNFAKPLTPAMGGCARDAGDEQGVW